MLRLYTTCLVIYVVSVLGAADGLFIDGCPIWGCRPSGSFSMYLDVPRKNVSVSWVSDVIMDPIPGVMGCVADSVNIVCQSNGPFKEDKGYVTLNLENGTLYWRDKLLHFPTLPLLDNYGDVTGSDGHRLVHYDADGKTYPIIKCYGLDPMFSMQLVGTTFLLLVGEQGGLVVRLTNAIPVAVIFLNATIQNTNGTFLPISQPVVNGQRFYVLTEFVPEDEMYDASLLNLQRLYAIDVHDRSADIMTIAWFYNFEMEHRPLQRPGQVVYRKDHLAYLRDNINTIQNVLWDYSTGSVYVTLPPPYMMNRARSFWIFLDATDDVKLSFRSDTLQVAHMATFETNTGLSVPSADYVWVASSDGKFLKIGKNGNVSSSFDVSILIGGPLTITSKVTLARDSDDGDDVLLFGATLVTKTQPTNIVLAVLPGTSPVVLWGTAVPDNMVVLGQLTGADGAASRIPDQIIFYAETAGKTARIVSLH